MSFSRVVLLLTTLLGCAHGAAAAQATGARPAAPGSAEPFVHESWTVQDGLPVNSINSLLQSRDGYIWATTWEGLVRFDGVRFTVFNSANSEGLPNNRLGFLHEARDGSLWMISSRMQLIRFRNGQFTHFGPQRGLADPATELHEDSQGVLWVATTNGLGRIEGERFMPVAEGNIRGVITAVARRRDGSVWVATGPQGLYRITSGRAERLHTNTALDTATIARMFEDPSGRLWLGSSAGIWVEDGRLRPVLAAGRPVVGVARFIFSPRTRTVFAFGGSGLLRLEADRAIPLDPRGGFQYGWPTTLDGEGSLWYGREGGLHRAAGAADAGRPGPPVVSVPSQITSLLVDREGSLWFGTSDAGLHRVQRAVFTTISEPEGLVYRNSYVVYQDRSDAVWVGTMGEGLSRIAEDGRITNYGPAQGFPRGVTSLYSDRRNRLWVSSQEGVLSCTLPGMTCTRHTAPPGVYALYGDSHGRLWAGMHSRVVTLEDGRWVAQRGWAGTSPVRAFAETRDGAIWMGTDGDGLLRYRDGRFTRVAETDGLPSNHVRSLYVDADGWLWIGTEGRGLGRLDPRAWDGLGRGSDRRIARIGTAQGLYDEGIHQILEDDSGRLWMSTNRGIFWVPRAELAAVAEGRAARVHSTSYTEREGMRNREANGGYQPAGIRARDGRLWFPTQDGVVVVDPARTARNRVPPPVVIERVAAGDTVYRPYGGRLQLGADQRDFEIDYAALSFVAPENVRFRYRLEGLTDQWTDVGNRRTAYFTNVPPGRYTFRIIASNNDGVWNEAGAALELRVAPRFHETRGAYGLLLLALVGLGAAGFQWRVRSLRRRERELSRLVEERTAALRRNEEQLEAQNAELAALHEARSRLFTNLSHEFRTPLTLILGPLRSLLDGRHGALHPSAREQAALMQRSGQRLLRLIKQILDLSKLQTGAVTFDRRTRDLVGFARAATLAFTPLAERRGIALRFQSEFPELPARFDAEQLEKVLLNLLSNALKFTGRGGRVTVSVGVEGEAAEIVVRDSGVGIAPEELPHVFERFYQADASATRRYEGTGIGLALARELVELHGGTIRAESTPGEGSTFTVRLPLGFARGESIPLVVGSAERAPAPPERLAATFSLETPDADAAAPWEEPEEDRTTVLVVDDNADVRAYVRSILERSYRVREAGDGAAGLARAREALPDLIVADVMMPEMDGLALGRALKDDPMTDAIPVVLLTARAAPEDQVAGFETGADAYLVKPFDPAVLEAQVASLLAQRRRLRERFAQGEAAPPTPAPAIPAAPPRWSSGCVRWSRLTSPTPSSAPRCSPAPPDSPTTSSTARWGTSWTPPPAASSAPCAWSAPPNCCVRARAV